MTVNVASVTPTYQDTAAAQHTLAMPASRPDGDLYLFSVASHGSAPITPPAGLAEIFQVPYGSGTVIGYWALFQRRGSSEPASYQFTSDAGHWASAVLRVTGADLDPVDAYTLNITTTNVYLASITAPAVTPGVSGGALLRLAICDYRGFTATPPTELYKRQETIWKLHGAGSVEAAPTAGVEAPARTFTLLNTEKARAAVSIVIAPALDNQTASAVLGGSGGLGADSSSGEQAAASLPGSGGLSAFANPLPGGAAFYIQCP